MQRITLRWFGALTAALGFGGMATAQYTPAIPQAPVGQTAGFSPNAPWMNQLPAARATPAASLAAEPQYLLVQALGQPGSSPAPKAGAGTPAAPLLPPAPSAPPAAPGSFPYAQPQGPTLPLPPAIASAQPPVVPPYRPTPFGTYGAPPQPRNIAFGAGMAPVPYGYHDINCANGCGSLKSDLGFVFGSCKSFFNACGPIPCNCNKGDGSCSAGGGCKKCPVFPLGHPYGKGCNMCIYDSYMNK